MKTCRKWQIVIVAVMGLVLIWTGRLRADFTFGTPVNLGPKINSSCNEYDPAVSADGLELYFQSCRAGGNGDTDLYIATRHSVEEEWQPAVDLGPTVNSSSAESGPSLSADGLTLYFNSNRPGGFGGHDLYMTTRDSRQSLWKKPVNLGPAVNSEFNEINPNISSDGLSLYFGDVEGNSVAPRPGGMGSTDIWVSTRASVSDYWGTPVNLGSPVNTSVTDGSPEISDDGLLLFINRWNDKSDGGAFFDICVATRSTPQDAWGVPINLGAPVNGPSWDGNAELSSDGRTLYFASTRSNAFGYTDLWQASVTPITDFNGDGKIDEAEVRIMTENMDKDEPLCDIAPTPFGDGIVDVRDMAVLMKYACKDIDDPTLTACWKFDEAEGLVAYDCTSLYDGVLVGNPSWQPDAGAAGGALALNGAGDYVATACACNPSDKPLSVFAWVKDGSPGQAILSQETGVNWLVVDAATGALASELKGNSRFSSRLISKAVITDGKWHRVGLVLDEAGRTLYVDGAVVAQDAQNKVTSAYGNLNIGAGKDLATGSFWSGMIDDVRIYNRAVKP
jgi:Tol biopolymer transport system component